MTGTYVLIYVLAHSVLSVAHRATEQAVCTPSRDLVWWPAGDPFIHEFEGLRGRGEITGTSVVAMNHDPGVIEA